MALFPIKNENSPCEAFLFCQNKVPNQFPIFVMKYAYGSGNLKFIVQMLQPLSFDCAQKHLSVNRYQTSIAQFAWIVIPSSMFH